MKKSQNTRWLASLVAILLICFHSSGIISAKVKRVYQGSADNEVNASTHFNKKISKERNTPAQRRASKRFSKATVESSHISRKGNTVYTSFKETLNTKPRTLKAGQFMMLNHSDIRLMKDVEFVSNNQSVATVSSDGIVRGEGKGSAIITLQNKGTHVCLMTYCIDVEDPDDVRFSYTLPNVAVLNEAIDLITITDQRNEDVKFILGEEELYAIKVAIEEDTFVWKATTTVKRDSLVQIQVKQNGKWLNTDKCLVIKTNSDTIRMSDEGIAFIACCEGFNSTVYSDPYTASIMNVGYGKVIRPGEPFYNNMTKREGYAMLVDNINNGTYSSDVNSFLMKNRINCSQQQFDALVSFSYNLGTSWLKEHDNNISQMLKRYRNLKDVRVDEFTSEFLKYHHAAKKCSLGLLYRRIDEMNMFFYGEYARHTYANNPHRYKIPGCIAIK